MDRFVTVWNSFAGVAGFGTDLKPVKKFENRDKAVARIWKALQRMNGDAMVEVATATDTANAAPKGAKDTATKGRAGKKPPSQEGAQSTARQGLLASEGESGVPREGSKTSGVVAMLMRKNGAALSEIMDRTSWQAHTVRAFMAGALKGAGYQVESFKPEPGERTYWITPK